MSTWRETTRRATSTINEHEELLLQEAVQDSSEDEYGTSYHRGSTIAAKRKKVVIRCTAVLFLVVFPVLLVLAIYLKTRSGSIRFASYYSDHMVLQMEPSSSLVWGYAESGTDVTVYFNGKEYHANRVKDCNRANCYIWRVTLDPTPPGGPYNITAQSIDDNHSNETVTLRDVLFGDVWFCGGQSNMQFTVPRVFNASDILATTSNYSKIRLLSVAHEKSNLPLDDVISYYKPWMLPSAESLGGHDIDSKNYFSAICYLFGREVHDHLGYPIGLISSNYGGSRIQTWMSSPDVVETCKNSSSVVIPIGSPGYWGEDSSLWNAMIHPFVNFTIKGVLWYQGEANSVEPKRYACLFPKLIDDWRANWYEGTQGNTDPMLPFGFVQVCTSNGPFDATNTNFTRLRWAQTSGYGYAPNPVLNNVFMAVSIDLPDPESPYHPIHPRYKQDLAHRLFLGARALAYSETDINYMGPFPKQVCKTSQRQIKVTYQFDKIKLISQDVFEVYCSDKTSDDKEEKYDAWIKVNETKMVDATSLMLTYQCPDDVEARSLRYIWKDMPCSFKNCAVYGERGDLPGPPFKLPVEQSCASK